MRNELCEQLGIEVPIFAFSHCRDVVVAVSRAGGLGVLGITYATPEELEADLAWIDDKIAGKPYGIDVLIPKNYDRSVPFNVRQADLPKEQVEFMRRVLDEAGIPRLPELDGTRMVDEKMARVHMTPEHNKELLDIALKHPIKALVSALGAPPKEFVDELKQKGILVGGVVGKVDHVQMHRAAGADFIVAQGTEAAGHTGKIASMVLWPEVVDAAKPMPVLAAGGVGNGRQFAAAMALGCAGVWCGSIWLGTVESEVLPEVKEKFWKARSEDAIQTCARSGKPARLLRSGLSDAWERPDAPPTAPLPYQTLLMIEPHLRVERGKNMDFKYYPVGQLVGMMKHETSVKQVIYDMINEYIETVESLAASLDLAE